MDRNVYIIYVLCTQCRNKEEYTHQYYTTILNGHTHQPFINEKQDKVQEIKRDFNFILYIVSAYRDNTRAVFLYCVVFQYVVRIDSYQSFWRGINFLNHVKLALVF